MKRYLFLVLGLCFHFCMMPVTHAQLIDFERMGKTGDTLPVVFAPVAHLELVEKRNLSVASDSLSGIAVANLFALAQEKMPAIPADTFIPMRDTVLSNTVRYELEQLLSGMGENPQQQYWPTPPLIDSLLTETNRRYGLLFLQSGFTRRKGNYGGQVWKAIGVGLLTMGSYYTVPYKAVSNMYLFKVDGRTKQIMCVARQEYQDKEPLDEKVYKKQFQALLESLGKKK